MNIDECRIPTEDNTSSRYPANVIHDGSDEVLSLFPNTESGKMLPTHKRTTDGSPNGLYGKFDKNHPLSETIGDSGSAARFFYTAKASQRERDFGLYGFEEKEVRGGGGRVEKGYDLSNPEEVKLKEGARIYGAVKTKKKNIHTTVKPIDLMRYLVKLVTRKGGVCLDPFLGSGTTAVACKAEKINYIGIEIDPDYVEIAKARIKAEIVMYDIFDFLEGE